MVVYRDEASALKVRLKQNASRKDDYDTILLVLRDIGDAVAFTYIDKWDIKPLCLAKEPAGFISGKEGLRLELNIFRYLKSKNKICILNDITNSIRHGDITVPM
jgi:hypothetical protein